MYNINNYQDGYCLILYNMPQIEGNNDGKYIMEHQITSYCLRGLEESNFTFENINGENFTFDELKKRNINSEISLSWSSSLDLADNYERYLNNNSYSLLDNKRLFSNCTSSWFGPLCRFTFDYKIDQTFSDIVLYISTSKSRSKNTTVSCYKHLHCETFLPCLDWREICDRKFDCLDGADEIDCWQLEINECNEDEYRCHNGQCIPIEFFRDDPYNPDCLDQTDEVVIENIQFKCYSHFTFRCEEHTCRPGELEFPCGDGECTNGLYKCYNGRSNQLLGDFCSNATACSMQLTDYVDSKWCKKFCSNNNCIKDNCPMFYVFRSIPGFYGHVRLVFSNEDMTSNMFPLPSYVCYNEELCGSFLPITKHFNNLTCRNFSELGLENIESYHNMETYIRHIKERFRGCLIETNEIDYYNCSRMYQCQNSSKCISKQRLLDGLQDCPLNDDETYNQSCSLRDIHQRFRCLDDNDNPKCISLLAITDSRKLCKYNEDESSDEQLKIETHISFQTICDGKRDLLPILINQQNHSDETECEHWPCKNTYSRCDQFWLCNNGDDEVNCSPSFCPPFHHNCIFPNDTSKVSCLLRYLSKPRSLENNTPENYLTNEYYWWCNRGIPIRFRMNDNKTKLYCLCPPSYYGNKCEYQNERISLTIQIRVQSDWRTLFTFLITLIDNEKYIHAYDYIQYLPVLNCRDKFHIYLLYSSRPKNLTKNYFIQINAFTQLMLNYRGSWIFPLELKFLPVHRLPILLTVPFLNITSGHKCWPPCIHGQCVPYLNNKNSMFCHCESGWSGIQCNSQHTCNCASGAICISESICLCSPGRYGHRCYVSKSPCHSKSCLNNGQCVFADVRCTSKQRNQFICLCPDGYSGDRCEHEQKQTRIWTS